MAIATVWTPGDKVGYAGLPGSSGSVGWAINDLGDLVGISVFRGSADQEVPTEWSHRKDNQSWRSARTSLAIPLSVNDSGQAVGFSETASESLAGTEWSGGTVIDLRKEFGLIEAIGINNNGEILGIIGSYIEWKNSYTSRKFPGHLRFGAWRH